MQQLDHQIQRVVEFAQRRRQGPRRSLAGKKVRLDLFLQVRRHLVEFGSIVGQLARVDLLVQQVRIITSWHNDAPQRQARFGASSRRNRMVMASA